MVLESRWRLASLGLSMFRPFSWRVFTASRADLGPVDVLIPVFAWEGMSALDGPRADTNNDILVICSFW